MPSQSDNKDFDVKSEICYISANCNRKPHAFDLRSDVILYPSANSVCLYNLQAHRHVQVLNYHTNQVNRVRWIRSGPEIILDAFSSSSLDGNALIFTKDLESELYTIKYKLIGAQDGLICHDCVHVKWQKGGQSNFVTCCSTNDERLIIWFDDEEAAVLDVNQFIFDIRISTEECLSNDSLLIAYAGSSRTVHLISFDKKSKVQRLTQLSGHEDWIQSIDLIRLSTGSLFIASGSQDNFIRVWSVNRVEKNDSKVKSHSFTICGQEFDVQLETVLLGHEAWVYSVQFAIADSHLLLLSCSMDKSLILWQQPKEDGLWSEIVRVGDVGGSALGFLGAYYDYDKIIGQAYNGAFHLWCHNNELNVWNPSIGLGGHADCVTDLSWDPNGSYLLSCSKDQTTRLHGPWLVDESKKVSWHELARPQIHGFDLNCLCAIDGVTFASGGDEKVVRILGATESFVKSMKNITKRDLMESHHHERILPKFASVPPLGLSNKAIYSDVDMDQHFKSVELLEPPLEETLGQNTLWPEIHKLYGHGFEISALASNIKGTLLASACKASKANQAGIKLWNINNNFVNTNDIFYHNLTVTQIRFSPDDKYLLSVSRDRGWCLFTLNETDEVLEVSKVSNSEKTRGHGRIVWDCSWTPDGDYFATCSRDKKIIIWAIYNSTNKSIEPFAASSFQCHEPVHTIDIAPTKFSTNYALAAGLESGLITIFFWNPESGWHQVFNLLSHHATVNRLRFKPQKSDKDELILASCADDRKLCLHKLICQSSESLKVSEA